MAGSAFSVVVNIGGQIGFSLGAAVGKARAQIGELEGSIAKAQAANLDQRGEYRSQIGDAVALGATLYGLIKPAVAFESAMADVRKVVNFETPQQFKAMGADIVAMSTRIPMAAEGLASIVAAAGQSGIARDELLGFAEAAAKMGIAFDISAQEAGETMAKWRTGMNLSQAQAEGLADAVNHLSNNSASAAAGISDVLRRVGGLAVTAGLTATDTAALGSSMLAAGATSEVAATALKNFALTMTAGESATKSQREAFQALGIDTVRLAKLMQTDAKGGILAVMEALKELPKYQQAAVASELFGRDSLGAIAPLLSNLDSLKASFAAVADSSNFAGSAQREFEERSQTTANNLQLFQNQIGRLGITVGSVLLPALNDTLGALGPMVGQVAALADRFPLATKVVAGAAMGLVGLKVATIGAGYAWTFLKGGALSAANVVVSSVGMTGRALTGLLSPMALVRGALFGLRMAVIGTGIGAIVVGLAAAGTWIYNNWSNLAAMFQGFGSAFMAAIGPARPLVEGVSSAISNLWQWVSGILGPVQGAEAGFRSFGESAGAAIGGAVAAVAGLAGKFLELPAMVLGALGGVVSSIGSINLFESGRALLSTFVDGIRTMLDKPRELVEGALASVRNLLPFSDAKEGPLSQLTASCAAVLPTFGEGIAKQGAGAVSGPLAGALGAALGAAMAVAPAVATGAPLPPGAEAPAGGAIPLPPIESLAPAAPAQQAAPGGAGGITINAPISITVPPGADGGEIARLVREEVERIIDDAAARQRSALHD